MTSSVSTSTNDLPAMRLSVSSNVSILQSLKEVYRAPLIVPAVYGPSTWSRYTPSINTNTNNDLSAIRLSVSSSLSISQFLKEAYRVPLIVPAVYYGPSTWSRYIVPENRGTEFYDATLNSIGNERSKKKIVKKKCVRFAYCLNHVLAVPDDGSKIYRKDNFPFSSSSLSSSSSSSLLPSSERKQEHTSLWYTSAELSLIRMKRKAMAKMIQNKINKIIQNKTSKKSEVDCIDNNNGYNSSETTNTNDIINEQNKNKWIIDEIENDNTCVRGLENLLVFDYDDYGDGGNCTSGRNQKQKRSNVRTIKSDSIDAVLCEQDNQIIVGKYDPNAVATKYIRNGSFECTRNAHTKGLQDAAEIIAINLNQMA